MAKVLLEDIGRQLATIAPEATTDVPGLGVRVHVALSPAPPVHVIAEPMLYLVFQGVKSLLRPAGDISYGPGELVTTAVHTPALTEVLVASREKPYRALEIPFDRRLVTGLIADMGVMPPASAEVISVHPLPEQVLDPVHRLLALAGDPDAAGVLAHGVKREIWYRVLSGPSGGAFVDLSRNNSVLSRIHEVTEWMRRNLHEPLDTRRVADLANMSATSLYRVFKSTTGATPGSYHKQLRLVEGRRRVAEGVDTIQPSRRPWGTRARRSSPATTAGSSERLPRPTSPRQPPEVVAAY